MRQTLNTNFIQIKCFNCCQDLIDNSMALTISKILVHKLVRKLLTSVKSYISYAFEKCVQENYSTNLWEGKYEWAGFF